MSTPHPESNQDTAASKSPLLRESETNIHVQDDSSQELSKVECSDPGPAITHREGFLTWVFNEWYMEMLACVIALVALAAVVITLKAHDGLPLPKWPFHISVNALVSIFSVILKATMLVPVAQGICFSTVTYVCVLIASMQQ